ncbi:MAG: ATP-binding protein [Desulfuromonas sp.]|nr:ATP-binding protein [Desulfuromonas sp.]
MSLFDFSEAELNKGEKHPKSIGTVQSVDNGRVFVQISSGEKLQLLRIGSLVAIPGGVGRYIIGHASRIWRHQPKIEKISKEGAGDEAEDLFSAIPENNGAMLTLLGCIRDRAEGPRFSRSMDDLPGIDEEVFLLADKNLHDFMNVVSATSKTAQKTPLHFGQFSLDTTASAFLDGNKLFQRHAALLGSTGSGKSWAVARILEQANQLPDTNVVLFDLHGEYKSLPYAKHYRIAGAADLSSPSEQVLFLPYWLLSYEEMQALFVEKSEFTAQNQSLVIHNAVRDQKKERLAAESKTAVLNQFTINSPVPFDLQKVLEHLQMLNVQMVPGVNKDKQGPYFGDFSRLIPRIEGKISDRRYGFMYQAPDEWHSYEALHLLAKKLLGFGKDGAVSTGIKIIDLSEVPVDVLPVVIGTLSRLIYSLQFWTPSDKRHPILIACDEAHLYLPKAQNSNPLERAAVESVERIAKEGRKYGVGLMVISQRPSDVSETILSQCNNVISLRLTNPGDQQTVRKLLPDSLGEIMQMLPLMDVGEAVVVGDAVLLPARIRVTEPNHKPLSATIDFWDEWGKTEAQEDNLYAVISENLRRQERLTSL